MGPEIRAAAIALGDLGRTKYINALKALASVSDIATRYHAVTGLVAGDLEEAKAMVGEVLTQKPLDADPVTLVTEFTKTRRGDTVLAELLEDVAIHPEVKKSVSTYHRQTGQLPKKLVGLFSDSSKDSLNLALLGEDRESLAQDVDRYGDAERGRRSISAPISRLRQLSWNRFCGPYHWTKLSRGWDGRIDELHDRVDFRA